MEKKEKLILATAVASHALTHVAELTFPATALLVAHDLIGQGKNYLEIGIAATVSAFMFGAAAMPSGWLVDRMGSRRVLLLFLGGTGASLVALSFMPNFIAFTAALAALGLFSGLYHPAGTTMISNGIREHGKAMGAHGVGGNLGLAATPFMAAALARALGDWRLAYAILGILPLLLLTLILFGLSSVGLPEKEKPSPNPPTEQTPVRPYLFGPLLVIFGMGIFNGMAYRGLMTFLPAYFAEKVRLDWSYLASLSATAKSGDLEAVVGGILTTLILLLGVVGQYTGGRLADKVKKEKLFTVIFFITSPLLLGLAFLDNLALVAVTGVFAFLYFANQPVGNSILPRYSEPRVRGMVFGLFFFINFGAGSTMGWIAGAIGDRFELSTIFLALSACLLAAGMLGLVLTAKTRHLK